VIEEDSEQRLEQSILRENEHRKVIADFESHLCLRGSGTTPALSVQASIFLSKIHALQEKVMRNKGSFQHKISLILQTQGGDLVKEFTNKLILKDQKLEAEKRQLLDDIGTLAENEVQLILKMTMVQRSTEFFDRNKKAYSASTSLKIQRSHSTTTSLTATAQTSEKSLL
jgi:hypothetical protein